MINLQLSNVINTHMLANGELLMEVHNPEVRVSPHSPSQSVADNELDFEYIIMSCRSLRQCTSCQLLD